MKAGDGATMRRLARGTLQTRSELCEPLSAC